MAESFQPFYVDRAKGGRAGCKGCKDKCPNGELRMAKIVPSPYGDNQQMKSWFHVDCMMNALLKQRPTTKRIETVDDIGNWAALSKDDQEFILKKINDMEKDYADKNSGKYTAKLLTNESNPVNQTSASQTPKKEKETKQDVIMTQDNNFAEFINLCKRISRVDAYTEKTAVVNNFFTNGTDGSAFKGDIVLWCKLLLPQSTKRVYNLKSKQLVKLFSRIFNTDHDDMLTHLEQGDVAKTIEHFFKKSRVFEPASESTLTIHKVEDFLEDLSKLTKEDEQIYHFKKIVKRCTLDDMKMIIRLIKGDLRINAGPKHILEGVHPDAYKVFQTSRNLDMVLERVLGQSSSVKHKDSIQKTVKAQIQIMTPVLPMLAEACKSVEMAMKKCPNGMFSEIKYDGERVQVHKNGKEFKYFSRSLKPVMPHKVSHFKDYLPQAFPKGEDLILDAEVLMVDVKTGKPLPFGTLGIHKQSAFKDAQVCLFVFDCLYYNGRVLLDVPIRKRREILYEHMTEIENHIMFSEQKLIREPGDLASMIAEVLQLGLEGLVLKDLESTYEPGKRHWLKVKKDYLFDGAMADTADLVVLGAWFGTGKKGGMMSVFLMGCHDKRRNIWVTVTKVHTGHDDSTLERLQKELTPLMVKISQDSNKVPSWLDCNKGLVPDFVAKDPKEQPVWEITGTEFTKANIHTADGISVRFPRVTRIRTDKNWETATNLDELKHLFKTSKEKTDVSLLSKLAETSAKSDVSEESLTKKIKSSSTKGTIDSFFKKKDVTPRDERKRKIESKSPETQEESPTAKKSRIKNEVNSSTSVNIKEESKNIKSKSESGSPTSFDSKEESPKTKKSTSTGKSDSPTSLISKEESPTTRKSKSKREFDSRTSSNSKEEPPTAKKSKSKRKFDSRTSSNSNEESPTAKKSKSKRELHSPTSFDSKADSPKAKKSKRKHDLDELSDTKSNTSQDSTSFKESNIKKEKIDLQLLPKDPLPNSFKGYKIGFYPDFISFTDNERREFERHWIAYGGTIVKSLKYIDVDFVIHNKNKIEFHKMLKLKERVPPHTRHVTKHWLIQCINDSDLCDTIQFAVTVMP